MAGRETAGPVSAFQAGPLGLQDGRRGVAVARVDGGVDAGIVPVLESVGVGEDERRVLVQRRNGRRRRAPSAFSPWCSQMVSKPASSGDSCSLGLGMVLMRPHCHARRPAVKAADADGIAIRARSGSEGAYWGSGDRNGARSEPGSHGSGFASRRLTRPMTGLARISRRPGPDWLLGGLGSPIFVVPFVAPSLRRYSQYAPRCRFGLCLGFYTCTNFSGFMPQIGQSAVGLPSSM